MRANQVARSLSLTHNIDRDLILGRVRVGVLEPILCLSIALLRFVFPCLAAVTFLVCLFLRLKMLLFFVHVCLGYVISERFSFLVYCLCLCFLYFPLKFQVVLSLFM